jgi:hypothetical protein
LALTGKSAVAVHELHERDVDIVAALRDGWMVLLFGGRGQLRRAGHSIDPGPSVQRGFSSP